MTTDLTAPLTHRRVLSLVAPIVLMGLTTPLLGLVDTAVIGQLGDATLIGAVAVSALIFTFIFWAFGFLRMGTTGLTAQALGAHDAVEIRAALGRALLIAGIAGCGLLLLQIPVRSLAFALVQGSSGVESEAATYFGIRMWSAPFTLANYAVLGWLVGMQQTRLAMVLQIFLNGTNAGLDALFVLQFDWGVAGIAAGTVIAEVATAFVGVGLTLFVLRNYAGAWDWRTIVAWEKVSDTLSVNRDIMIRTLVLLLAFSFFTMEGARAGDLTLAANAILMQFVSFSAFFLDGFAFGAEALVGAAIGARQRVRFVEAVRLTTGWAFALSVVLSLTFLLLGGFWIDFLTTSTDVREVARLYLPWAAALPVLSFACFQLDGIFIGATRARDMRDAAFVSTAAFFLFWWLLLPFGNHGLWAALALFNVTRAFALGRYYPRLLSALR
ncbi:MAG: MATE family efflux transporter [Rhodobiaceae bacterium]|nr:MATE family efflux transporter [Rhodobiaceae bacterium]